MSHNWVQRTLAYILKKKILFIIIVRYIHFCLNNFINCGVLETDKFGFILYMISANSCSRWSLKSKNNRNSIHRWDPLGILIKILSNLYCVTWFVFNFLLTTYVMSYSIQLLCDSTVLLKAIINIVDTLQIQMNLRCNSIPNMDLHFQLSNSLKLRTQIKELLGMLI